jgi:Thioredoxin like C-terminal domain
MTTRPSDVMPARRDRGRRAFLGTAAMTLAAAEFGGLGLAGVTDSGSRQLTAIGDATAWLNSPPLSTASLLGKPVLVQFGTYTCINWLRTLPYVRAWHQQYMPGLAVIGVHTPEFAFEKDLDNVRRAMPHLKVGFPIALDNDYAIWRAFDNHYWPALYLLDARGRVRYRHFGEGAYEASEKAVQRLLAQTGATGGDRAVVPIAATEFDRPADWQNLKSPEIYLGHDRSESFASPGGASLAKRRAYKIPARLDLNRWALDGEWTMERQPTVLGSAPGRIVCRFHARDVHLVMGPLHRGGEVRFRVSVDGQPPGSARGVDVGDSGAGTVMEQRLYQLIRQPGPIVDRTFQIEFLDASVEAFAFTFG